MKLSRTINHANRRFWDADATRYHEEHSDYLSSFYWCPEMLHERDANLLGDTTGDCILELGCGSAACTEWLSTKAQLAVGIDISRGMLGHATKGLNLAQADALDLPFADDSFDKVFSAFGALPFLSDIDQALSEVSRVLRPDGSFVCALPHPFRWVFPDDPQSHEASISYFEDHYAETNDQGDIDYIEFHRTMSEWISAFQVRNRLLITKLIEPEWPSRLTTTWGQWSPRRGRIFPGTAIFCTLNVK